MTRKGTSSSLLQHPSEQILRIDLVRPAAFRQPGLAGPREQFADPRPFRDAALDEVGSAQGEDRHQRDAAAEAVESLTSIGMDDGKGLAGRGRQDDSEGLDLRRLKRSA